MISIQNLQKSFGKNHVLKGINIRFDQPGITAVVGPNGSGKTTLIKCILGMVIPNEGTIAVDGKDIKGNWAYRNAIDYLPQIARFPENLKVYELLSMIKDIRGQAENSQQFIDIFNLEPFMNQRLGNLSGGTLQKVNITLAMMYDSPLLILDEPTTGLDPLALVRFKKLVAEAKAKGKIILITTHIMSLVEEIADDIVFLLEGNIHFQGSLNQLMTSCNAEKLEDAIAQILYDNKYILSGNGQMKRDMSVNFQPNL